jgi:hypothetical protein
VDPRFTKLPRGTSMTTSTTIGSIAGIRHSLSRCGPGEKRALAASLWHVLTLAAIIVSIRLRVASDARTLAM